MARSHGRVQVTIWADEDFRALSSSAQRAYLMLISQPQINNCGVLPYVPRKWSKLAADGTPESMLEALTELDEARFVVVDDDTQELLVRSFIKHDRIEKQPLLKISATRQFPEIESPRIRQMLRDEYPQIFASIALQKPLFGPETGGVSKDLPKGVSEGVSDERGIERGSDTPPRARDRASAAPAPSPTPAPYMEKEPGPPGVATETIANDLPVEKERLTLELLSAIGSAGDSETHTVVRSFARRLPEGALAKVLESVGSRRVRNKAEYAVKALKRELEERQPPPPRTVGSLRKDPERYVREVGFKLPDDVLDEALLELLPTDESERIRLADLAAELRRASEETRAAS